MTFVQPEDPEDLSLFSGAKGQNSSLKHRAAPPWNSLIQKLNYEVSPKSHRKQMAKQNINKYSNFSCETRECLVLLHENNELMHLLICFVVQGFPLFLYIIMLLCVSRLQLSEIFLKTSLLQSRGDTELYSSTFSVWVSTLIELEKKEASLCCLYNNASLCFTGYLHVSCAGHRLRRLLCAIAGKSVRGMSQRHIWNKIK